jgi:hypothetical protein
MEKFLKIFSTVPETLLCSILLTPRVSKRGIMCDAAFYFRIFCVASNSVRSSEKLAERTKFVPLKKFKYLN